MREFQGKRYWLVGASAGLGRAVAERMSALGCELVISARGEDELNELANALPGKAEVVPVDVGRASSGRVTADIVGPVCETGDFLAKDRELNLSEDDLVAILSAGAYGFVMSSNYNSRGRAPEIMVRGDTHRCIRRRETIEDQLALEIFP